MCVDSLERTLFDLLAPISAQDQQEIRSLLNRVDQADAAVERLFTLLERRGANYRFFFAHTTDPGWIPILKERGHFSDPPNSQQMSDGQVNAPYWWPIHYLHQVAHNAPDQVVEVILQLPKCDNPKVNAQILDIAQQLPGSHSWKLKPQVLAFGKGDLSFLGERYAELFTHWVLEDVTDGALELLAILVGFKADPEWEIKRKSYLEYGIDREPPVTPVSMLHIWEYREMFERGVRPLTEKEPVAVARLLTDAAEVMIRLRTAREVARRSEWRRFLRGMVPKAGPHR